MKYIKYFKRLLGFDSPYSWTKWVRISLAIVAFYITEAFLSNFLIPLTSILGIFGMIIAAVIFMALFLPLLLLMVGASVLIGTAIGGTASGVKQRKSFKETVATGSSELIKLEKLRMKSLGLDILMMVLAALLVAGFFLLGDPILEEFGEGALYGYIIVSVIVLLVFAVAKAPLKQAYRQAFKVNVVIKGLEEVLPNMTFRPQEKLDEALVRASNLFPKYNDYSGNDYLAANHHGHHFVQSDIHLQEVREETYHDEEGSLCTRTVRTTLFRGRLMILNYDAISDEPVAVLDRKGGKPKINEMVQTELDDFNQRFTIKASDPTDALRILTPQVLEGIVLARGKVGCPLNLSFKDDKLYLAIENGDSFEAAEGDATLSEQRQRVTSDIQAMLDLVDTLYLKK